MFSLRTLSMYLMNNFVSWSFLELVTVIDGLIIFKFCLGETTKISRAQST